MFLKSEVEEEGDNLVLFCQQQDLSVDIQLYSQLKQLRKRIVGKSIINFEIQ